MSEIAGNDSKRRWRVGRIQTALGAVFVAAIMPLFALSGPGSDSLGGVVSGATMIWAGVCNAVLGVWIALNWHLSEQVSDRLRRDGKLRGRFRAILLVLFGILVPIGVTGRVLATASPLAFQVAGVTLTLAVAGAFAASCVTYGIWMKRFGRDETA